MAQPFSKFVSLTLVTVLFVFVQGCSSNSVALDSLQHKPVAAEKTARTNQSTSLKQNNNSNKKSEKLKAKFMVQYSQWKGTRYQLGGNSKSGIDCSAFVQLAYLDQLDKRLPRTTERQVKIGKSINQSKLRIGDLVFFKTSFKVRHVGIYIGNGQFMHASTSKGVTISNLNNVYWKSKYWTSRRVI